MELPKNNYLFNQFRNSYFYVNFRNILKQGGTAADAGIAAMLCVGLVNCHSAGVGGGHFSIFYNRTDNSVFSVNAREKAPLEADEDMFVDTYNASTFGKSLKLNSAATS